MKSPTIILLALLASGSAMGQSALTPQWDVKAQHDRQEADGATSARINRFQDAPWVAQTQTVTSPVREIVMQSSGHYGCAVDVQEPK